MDVVSEKSSRGLDWYSGGTPCMFYGEIVSEVFISGGVVT